MAACEDSCTHVVAPRRFGAHARAVELRQLEHFLAVVRDGSFTAAAGKLYMVQSSLSASLLSLERELGADLFIRGRKGAELTDAGRSLLEPARAALQSLQAVRDAVADVSGLRQGTVRIACLPASVPESIDVGPTIRRFHQEHRGVDVQLVPADGRGMVEMVADGEVDFAIGPATADMGPRLSFQPLVQTELAIVCPLGHRLAGARDVDPRDLLEELIIDLPRTWESRNLFDGLLRAQGLERRASVEVDDWLGALAMVHRGTGIAYGPRECVEEGPFNGLAIAEISGAPTWAYGVITRDEALRGAAGRAFLAAYLETCAAVRRQLLAGRNMERADAVVLAS
jgi:DNA-binding transcriptional LysR family regulator